MKPIYTGLSEEEKIKLDMYPPPHLFAVVSWGCAATTWLSGVLNAHPDIFCLHAANHGWITFGKAPLVDGLDYLRFIGTQGTTHLAAGDVHGIYPGQIPQLKETLGEQFSCACVVREPMSRLRSLIALFERGQQFHWWDVSFIQQVVHKELPLPDDSYASKLFVFGANCFNAVLSERELGPIYRSEDLTSDPSILADFVNHITNGKVKATEEWAIASISKKGINSHSKRAGTQSLELAPWQKEVLRLVISPKSWEIYAELGYPIPEFV